MIRIHTLLIGQPQTLTDEAGTWQSAIFRQPFAGPVALQHRGLVGDQVADTERHGSADQAVCCHPLDHYAYWNTVYGLDTAATMLGPGGVGENWTLSGVTEDTVCVGDIFRVGTARVQVSSPRFPCIKQERKLQLPAFHRRTVETLRTGFYLRVLDPGLVQAGDTLALEERRHNGLTIQSINACVHQRFDPDLATQLMDVPELTERWKYLLHLKLTKQWPE